MIDCWLLYVQWQIFHAYSGQEQVQQWLISKKGWGGTTGQWLLTATGKRELWVGTENLASYSGISLLFFLNYKRGLLRIRSMALSKHVTHYGPRPGFPYFNLAASQREGIHYLLPGIRAWSALWVEPWRTPWYPG